MTGQRNIPTVISIPACSQSSCQKCRLRGKEVEIFFTGQGVLLTQDPDWEQLVGKARLAVCDVSFRANGLAGDVPGLGFKDFATQARNADMIAECDRYVVF